MAPRPEWHRLASPYPPVSVSPCLPVSLSPCLLVSLSLSLEKSPLLRQVQELLQLLVAQRLAEALREGGPNRLGVPLAIELRQQEVFLVAEMVFGRLEGNFESEL